jgi:hypothetical protein
MSAVTSAGAQLYSTFLKPCAGGISGKTSGNRGPVAQRRASNLYDRCHACKRNTCRPTSGYMGLMCPPSQSSHLKLCTINPLIRAVGRSITNEAVVQSLIAVQRVTTSADNQAFKEDTQQVAARITTRLREAGYLCTVLENPRSPSAPCLQPK